MTIEKKAPRATLTTTACSTSASASLRRPAPNARATAEEIPPPMAPAETICINMTTGNTNAMPANASVPRCETHQVSISPVDAWASMTRILGQARRSNVGTMAPRSSSLVRESTSATRGGGASVSAMGAATTAWRLVAVIMTPFTFCRAPVSTSAVRRMVSSERPLRSGGVCARWRQGRR